MAENKRIRVSTDTTALQELRQQGEAVLNTFNQLEERFKGLAADSLDLLHQQIDLIKERNDLLNGANLGITPPRGEDGYQKEENPHKAPIRGTGSTDDILRRILERTVSIDSKIQDPLANPGGGVDPNKDKDDLGEGGAGIMNSKMGRKIFSMASLAAIMTAVKRVAGVGRDLMAYDVGQRTADNSYERRFAAMESGIMNTLTFGFSSLVAKEERKNWSRVQENAEATKLYSQLYNYSYKEALAREIQGYFGDRLDLTSLSKTNKAQIEAGAVQQDNSLWQNYQDANLALAESYSAQGAGTASFLESLWNWVTGDGWHDNGRWEEERQIWHGENGINREAQFDKLLGLVGDPTETLGLSLTDYYKKIAQLGKAGVRSSNTSEADLYQMLVGQTIRGYSDEMMRQILAVTRFGATDTMTGTQVVQAMDTNLRNQGYDDQYIASTLEEYVASFSRFAENMLGKVGRIETDNMIQSMTSIQNATGTEGRQLERLQQALTGQSVSQDDVTQALLLRTARQMNPNLSMFDLEATIENMPNDINLQRQFLKTIQDMTGGGDMMKYTLQAIFPNLSKNDILAITEGRKDLTDIFDHGSVEAQKYNPQNAAEKLTPGEEDTAATANKQLVAGIKDVFGEKGEKIDSILIAIGKKHPVGLDEIEMENLGRMFSSAFLESLNSWMRNGISVQVEN